MNKRALSIAALVVAAATLYGGWRSLAPRQVAPPAPGGGTASSPSAAQAQAPAAAGWPTAVRWRVGEVLTYQVEVRSTVRINLGAFAGNNQVEEQVLPFNFRGRWQLDVLEEEAGQALVRGSLEVSGLDAQVGQALPPEALSPLRAALQMPVVLRISRSGRVEGIRAPAGLVSQPAAHSALKTLVAALQVVYPDPPVAGGAWESIEQDATGEYVARYQRRNGRSVEKAKVRYLRIATEEGMVLSGGRLSATADTTATATVTPEGWPSALDHAEDLTTRYTEEGAPGSQQALVARLESRIHAELVGRASVGGSAEGLGNWRALPEEPLARAVAVGQDLAEGPPVALPELLASLARVEQMPERDAQREELRLQGALERTFRADRSAITAAVQAVLDGMAARRAAPILGALAAEGSPEAQEALVTIWRKARDAEVRLQALSQLGLVERPTAGAVKAVTEALASRERDVHGTAALNLGSMAMAQRREDPAAAQRTSSSLVALLRRARTPEEVVLALDALGNAGEPETLALLQEHLASPQALVRDAAVRSLRSMPPGPADQLIAAALKDAEPVVRQGAVFAVGSRKVSDHLADLAQALQRDTNRDVRAGIVSLLALQVDVLPRARELLEAAAASDPDPRIREAAGQALRPGSERGRP